MTGLAAAFLTGLGRRREAALLVAAFAGAEILTWMLKALFQRPRPSFDEPLATALGFSFPSGHALTSLVVYGTVAYLLATRMRLAILAGAALVIAAIGFSRLYLGVHYLSDVLAGYAAGLAWLIAAFSVAAGLSARRAPRLAESRPARPQRAPSR